MGSQHGRVPPNPQHAPKAHGRRPSAPKPHSNSGSSNTTQKCCSYQEAGRALLRRRYRLAARYVRLDVKRRLGIA